MSRLPAYQRADLDAEQQELFDRVSAHRPPAATDRVGPVEADGTLSGPLNARLLNPALGHAAHDLARAVLQRTSLTERAREMAILVGAQQWDCPYYFRVHTEVGLDSGITAEEIAALADGRVPENLEEYDAEVVACARSLATTWDLDDERYRCAVAVLGERAVFELVMTMCSYHSTAVQLRVFRVA